MGRPHPRLTRRPPARAGRIGRAAAWAGACWLALIAGTYLVRVAAPNFIPGHLWRDAVGLATPSLGSVVSAAVRLAGGIALVAALLAGAAGQGRSWIRFAGGGRGTSLPPLLGPALGLGVCGTISYAAGFLGLYRTPALAALLVVPALTGVGALRRSARSVRDLVKASPRDVSRLAAGLAAVAWIGCALAAPVPETEMDSLKYHLGKPLRYLVEGKLAPNGNVFFRFPSLWEAGLTPLLGLGSEPAAKLLQPAVVGLLGLLLWAAVARAKPGAGALAAALLVAGYGTGRIAVTAKNDVLVALFVLAAFVLVREASGRGARARLLLAGLALGFALSTKSTALLGIAAVGVAHLAAARRVRVAALAAVTAGLVAGYAPWGARDWLEAGNPVFPFARGVFGAGMPPASERLLRDETHRYTAASYAGPLDKLRAPWSLAIAEGLWVLPAVALPGAVVLLRAGPLLPWAAAGLCALAVFAIGPPQPRYLLQGMPMLAGALELSLPLWGGVWPARLLAALVALDAGRGWTDYWSDRGARLAVTAGVAGADRYRLEKLTTYADAVAWADAHLPARAHVLIFGPTRAFPLARRTTLRTDYEKLPPLALAEDARDAAHLRRKLRQAGWTHLLYDRLNAVAWAEQMSILVPDHATLARWARVWRDRAALVYESPALDLRQGGFMLYDLRGPAGRGARFTLPGAEAFVHRPQALMHAGRLAEARADFDRLTRVAGAYALVRQARVAVFEAVLSRSEARRELEAVAATGFRSVWLFHTLSRYAREAGEPAAATEWRTRAEALAFRQEAWRP